MAVGVQSEKKRVPLTKLFKEKVINNLNHYVEEQKAFGVIKTKSFVEDVLLIPK